MNKQPILIAGLPRSGTTWIGEIISTDKNIRYYYEPDNEKTNSYAYYFKKTVHRFPFRLAESNDNDDYYYLWKNAFSGIPLRKLNTLLFRLFYKQKVPGIETDIGNKTGFIYTNQEMKDVNNGTWNIPFKQEEYRMLAMLAKMFIRKNPSKFKYQIVIKSVHSPLCLEWIDFNFGPKMVIVLRNPFALYASYKRLFMPDAFRNILSQDNLKSFMRDKLGINLIPRSGINEEAIFQIILVYKILANQLKANKHWYFISHDRLCFNPVEQYKKLYSNLGLHFDSAVENKLNDLNTSGGGFIPKRIGKDQPMKWKKELIQKEVDLIKFWMRELDVKDFIENYVYGHDL